VSTTKPRNQVTLNTELARALAELGGTAPRSRAVRDLVLRGAEAVRAERSARSKAREHLRRIASGKDNRYDFTVSERVHAER
jgi:hypothetical protein